MLTLNDSVKGRERGIKADTSTNSPLIEWLLKLLQSAQESIARFPPQNRNADVNRFGNVAFRDCLFALQDQLVPELFTDPALSDVKHKNELEGYFINSLGSSQRIDYGTGHELHFLVFLAGFEGRFSKNDYPELVLKVFSSYLQLMRTLQKTYWLEPAGSHGVWGLDDYHFLPFLFGSAQLCGHANIRPRAVHSAEMVHYLAPNFIYFDSILNILQIKAEKDQGDTSSADIADAHVRSEAPNTNALRWMSPVLDDISAVKTWEKVNSGLIQMWRVEVMSKLPIMQHLLFGSGILDFKRRENEIEDVVIDSVQHYTHSLRGDCCGNPLPSIYASTKTNNQQPGLPFD